MAPKLPKLLEWVPSTKARPNVRSFLDLPAEIRNMIYDYALIDPYKDYPFIMAPNKDLPIQIGPRPYTYEDRRKVRTDILTVSRQLHVEAASRLYKDVQRKAFVAVLSSARSDLGETQAYYSPFTNEDRYISLVVHKLLNDMHLYAPLITRVNIIFVAIGVGINHTWIQLLRKAHELKRTYPSLETLAVQLIAKQRDFFENGMDSFCEQLMPYHGNPRPTHTNEQLETEEENIFRLVRWLKAMRELGGVGYPKYLSVGMSELDPISARHGGSPSRVLKAAVEKVKQTKSESVVDPVFMENYCWTTISIDRVSQLRFWPKKKLATT